MANKNIQMKNKQGGTWDNLYPITLTENVFNAAGRKIDDILSEMDRSIQTKADETSFNNKINNLSVNQINKNLGKIDQTYLADELLQQIAGNTPVNTTPKDNSITLEKLDNKVSSMIKDSKLSQEVMVYFQDLKEFNVIENKPNTSEFMFRFDRGIKAKGIGGRDTVIYWDTIQVRFPERITTFKGTEYLIIKEHESFVFDLKVNNLAIVPFTEIRQHQIRLLSNEEGRVVSKAEGYSHLNWKIEKLKTRIGVNLYLKNEATFRYKEQWSGTVNTFGFESLVAGDLPWDVPPFISHVELRWEDVKEKYPSRVVGTSGAEMMWLLDGESFAFNTNTLEFEVVQWTAVRGHHAIFAMNLSGKFISGKIMTYIAKLSGEDNKNGIAYLTDHYPEINDRVLSLQGYDTFSLVFMTDNHNRLKNNSQINGVRSIQNVIDAVDIKCVVNGGDIGNEAHGSKKPIRDSFTEIMDEYYKLSKDVLSIIGNHDDATGQHIGSDKQIELSFEEEELYNIMQKRAEHRVMRDEKNPKGNYFYYDIPESKVRIIGLNSEDYPLIKQGNQYKYNGYEHHSYSNKQLNWVAKTALKVPENYAVMFFSHVSPIGYNMIGTEMEVTNGQILIDIIKAFKDGTGYTSTKTTGDFGQFVEVDYTEQGANDVIGVFAGHSHYDNMNVYQGIQLVTTLCAYTSQFNDAPERVAKTLTETAFDVITVNKKNKMCYLTRYGAGTDREFSY